MTSFLNSAGAVDKKQTDIMLETFEYFHEKGKEDDLHKSYNDRSYLSSEDTGLGESRTGTGHTHVPPHTHAHTHK